MLQERTVEIIDDILETLVLADLHYNLLDRVYTQHSNGYQEKVYTIKGDQ